MRFHDGVSTGGCFRRGDAFGVPRHQVGDGDRRRPGASVMDEILSQDTV